MFKTTRNACSSHLSCPSLDNLGGPQSRAMTVIDFDGAADRRAPSMKVSTNHE
jgi:hypothetical protein